MGTFFGKILGLPIYYLMGTLQSHDLEHCECTGHFLCWEHCNEIGLEYSECVCNVPDGFLVGTLSISLQCTCSVPAGYTGPCPQCISLIYTTWMDARWRLVSASHSVYDIMQYPLSWKISLSHIIPGIHSMSTKVGHQTIVLLLQIDRALVNTKQRLVKETRRIRHVVLLPLTTEDANHQPYERQNGPGLRVCVWNLEALRKQNANNACCVCWVLQNITDPEAINSAIRLSGTVRWFNGDSDHNPPYDSIVSTFEACFDSMKQLYPGMRDWAYFSAWAIFQINTGARAQSHKRTSEYPIPAISPISHQYTSPDLDHAIYILECNFDTHGPTLDFPRGDTKTNTHLLWISNLFVDLTSVDPNLTLSSYGDYLSTAVADH